MKNLKAWLVTLLGICFSVQTMAGVITIQEIMSFSVADASQFGPGSSPLEFAVGPVSAGGDPFEISFEASASSGSLDASQAGLYVMAAQDVQKGRSSADISLTMLYQPLITSFSTFLGAAVTTELTVDTGISLIDGTYCVLCLDPNLQGGSLVIGGNSPLTLADSPTVEVPRVEVPLVDLVIASLDAEVGLDADQELKLDLFSFSGELTYQRRDSLYSGAMPFSLPFGEAVDLIVDLPAFGTWDFQFSNIELVNQFSNQIDLSVGVGAAIDVVGLDPILLAYVDDLFTYTVIDTEFALDYDVAPSLPSFSIEMRNIPEPATLVLLATGLIAFGLKQKKGRNWSSLLAGSDSSLAARCRSS